MTGVHATVQHASELAHLTRLADDNGPEFLASKLVTSRSQQIDYIRIISDEGSTPSVRRQTLRRFAEQNDWTPSDILLAEELPAESIVGGHVLVDFGLETSAAITILREATYRGELGRDAIRKLLSLSYNSAVDWHIILDSASTSLLHNRLSEPLIKEIPLSEDPAACSATGFQRYTKGRFRPQHARVDEVILSSIDFWRKAISGELRAYDINESLSKLFNALICIRIIEDSDRRDTKSLLASHSDARQQTIYTLMKESFDSLKNRVPGFVKEWLPSFTDFDALSSTTVSELLSDFYQNKDLPYAYDFGLLSRHALSLVYEKYVSELQAPDNDSGQPQIFPLLARSHRSTSKGIHYTPQYLARFMARYVIEMTPMNQVRNWTFVDPACGSGVFLRAIAERLIQSGQAMEELHMDVFSRLHGRDINPAARNAALLSLTLLHVAHHGVIPAEIDIVTGDGFEFLKTFRPNAVIANPPFIPWTKADTDQRAQITEVFGAQAGTDYSYAFFKHSLNALADNGLAVFLLPHAFLIANATRTFREQICESHTIELIADLSLIEVFEHASVYVILIAVRKRKATADDLTRIVRVRDFPGLALDAALGNQDIDNEYFQTFSISQSTLSQVDWRLLPPKELEAVEWLQRMPTLESYARPREGMVTGADSVFKVASDNVPDSEQDLWRPLLTDKEMQAFRIPARTESRIFFPVSLDVQTAEKTLQDNFPWTWEHLQSQKHILEDRASVRTGTPWWRPHRVPEYLDSPKLVAPHVSRRARFSLDATGDYIVTRAPALELDREYARPNFPLFLLGVVNSSSFFWQLAAASHRYANGYVLVEPKQLVAIRVPRIDEIASSLYGQVVDHVRLILRDGLNDDRAQGLDELVFNVYGFPNELRNVFSPGI